jgi:hypothetical protein
MKNKKITTIIDCFASDRFILMDINDWLDDYKLKHSKCAKLDPSCRYLHVTLAPDVMLLLLMSFPEAVVQK